MLMNRENQATGQQCFVVGGTKVCGCTLPVSPVRWGSIILIGEKQFFKQKIHLRYCQRKMKKCCPIDLFQTTRTYHCPSPEISELWRKILSVNKVMWNPRNYENLSPSLTAWGPHSASPLTVYPGSLCPLSLSHPCVPSLLATPIPWVWMPDSAASGTVYPIIAWQTVLRLPRQHQWY